MKKKKTGALTAAAVLAFLLFAGAMAASLFFYNRYNSLSSEIRRVLSIPEAAAGEGERWHNRNADAAYQSEDQPAGEYLYHYMYDNIEFISYSEYWNEAKLIELKDELLSNTHGPEIDYLDQVIIYAEEDSDALGYHDDAMRFYPVGLFMPGLLPQGIAYNFTGLSSTIELTGGDSYTDVAQLSRTLSHEYGHHFTNYYFFNDYDDLSQSEYYRIRNNPAYTIFYEWKNIDHYYDNHSWYLWELAADDYVYFYGSPRTRYTEDYLDDLEVLRLDVRSRKKKNEYYDSLTFDSFNLSPHLNAVLDMPDRIPGLREMFENCMGVQTPQNPYDASGIRIDIDKDYSAGYAHYEITWNKPWTEDNVMYTLVAYYEDGGIHQGVKTINGSEEARAYMGKVVYSHYYLDVDMPEKLVFRVVVTFPDGFAAVSPAVEREF